MVVRWSAILLSVCGASWNCWPQIIDQIAALCEVPYVRLAHRLISHLIALMAFRWWKCDACCRPTADLEMDYNATYFYGCTMTSRWLVVILVISRCKQASGWSSQGIDFHMQSDLPTSARRVQWMMAKGERWKVLPLIASTTTHILGIMCISVSITKQSSFSLYFLHKFYHFGVTWLQQHH